VEIAESGREGICLSPVPKSIPCDTYTILNDGTERALMSPKAKHQFRNGILMTAFGAYIYPQFEAMKAGPRDCLAEAFSIETSRGIALSGFGSSSSTPTRR